MRRRAFLVVLLFALPFRAEAQSNWNQGLAGSVYASAFSFMGPRTLQPIPLSNLTLWGLRGLTALDPSIAPSMTSSAIALNDRGAVVLSLPLPKAGDTAGWAALAALMCSKAAALSPAIAQAGTGGIVTSFFDELFNHLDPYSRYIAPNATAGAPAMADPGLDIALVRHHAVIGHVDPDGPAAAAGLLPGDRILAIDGVATHRQDSYTLNAALSGVAGSEVTLLIQQRRGKPRTFSLTRVATAPMTVLSSLAGPNLLVRITGFETATAAEFRQQVVAALAAHQGVQGVIIDLRGNRGGLLDQAVGVADSLIASGTIAQASGRDPQSDQHWQADAGDITAGLPIAVLVDGRTASAAEVLAAALSDDRRAVVIGSATFGKGLVQAATSLPDGGDLLVTWARLLAPLGWPLQGLGVMPQICTSGSADAVESQLQALTAGQQPMAATLQTERAARPGMTLDQILQLREACPAALGSSLDLQAAQFLLSTTPAYQTALIPSGG
ncbi:PDZ domain-containing protein [Acidisoma cellulosilytica]|uniref:PDZ domain-containing protein n=1 Tax=Acidisoma cellulosilyticum TaxID=2802395 RepID=A0A963YZB7_9PROT|nr:S41 family peptidase [Acidisoma cellulosilyticum]MCB8879859.1 PDZ domain-containing protein [Acidisoma cellulosilyticum]